MRSIKPPYTVTIEITEDADGWHLPTSEEYERRMKRREYIADFTQGKHGENVMPKQELIRCKDCKFSKAYYHGSESNLGMFTYLCTQGLYGMNADDYCSRAERKEE